jgi:ATP synthase protein I
MNDKKLKKILDKKEKRKLIAKRKKNGYMWFGLGMFGLVGWSIVIPTFIGVVIGIIIDTRYDFQFSWTLMLMFLGLILGCINVWFWISKEKKSIEKDNEDDK